MTDPWATAGAIIGVATVIASTFVSIYKHNRKPPQEPTEASMEGRVIKLEGEMQHALQGQERLEKENMEKRRRFEDVVDRIYSAIDDLRKEVFEIARRGSNGGG